jgi:hypothetical protein
MNYETKHRFTTGRIIQRKSAKKARKKLKIPASEQKKKYQSENGLTHLP